MPSFCSTNCAPGAMVTVAAGPAVRGVTPDSIAPVTGGWAALAGLGCLRPPPGLLRRTVNPHARSPTWCKAIGPNRGTGGRSVARTYDGLATVG
jgi:hypothetical protein